MNEHTPVLVEEVLAALSPRPDGIYVDATFGRGGHTRALLDALGEGGRVIALDRDPAAVEAGARMAATEPRLTVEHANFAGIGEVIERHDLRGAVDGMIFDLGVSSPQLDDPGRGFGFRGDGPLDMRMDQGTGASAAEWLARAPVEAITDALRRYGEEPQARRIALAIERQRRLAPIDTTAALARLVVAVKGAPRPGAHHPATRTFQALRIVTNRELDELAGALEGLPECLAPGGRVAVISFHSLEDRIVKRAVRRAERGEVPRHLPVPGVVHRPRLRALGRALRPRVEEVERNPRARSAVLRVAERPR